MSTDDTANLRRASLRAAKLLDRDFTRSDVLLGALEAAYANGSDDELADAVMSLVHSADPRPVLNPDRLNVTAELFAWRIRDRIDGTATDEATLRLRDIADRILSTQDYGVEDLRRRLPSITTWLDDTTGEAVQP